MNSFDKCRELESVSRSHLERSLLKGIVYDGRFVRVDKGPHAAEIQATLGDYLWNSDELTAWTVEHKCEYTNDWGNFFLETFSNLSFGKPGWLWTLDADILLYHFVRDGKAYMVRLSSLRSWLFSVLSSGRPRAHNYGHRQQAQHDQLNDTWGYCVNIEHVRRDLNVKTYDVEPILIPEYEDARKQRIATRSNGQAEMWAK